MLQAVRVRASGYAHREPHAHFLRRCGPLLGGGGGGGGGGAAAPSLPSPVPARLATSLSAISVNGSDSCGGERQSVLP